LKVTLPYTEEDKINILMEKSALFRRLVREFELELDFTKEKKK